MATRSNALDQRAVYIRCQWYTALLAGDRARDACIQLNKHVFASALQIDWSTPGACQALLSPKPTKSVVCHNIADFLKQDWGSPVCTNIPVDGIYASQLPALALHLSIEAGHTLGHSHLQRVASLPATKHNIHNHSHDTLAKCRTANVPLESHCGKLLPRSLACIRC